MAVTLLPNRHPLAAKFLRPLLLCLVLLACRGARAQIVPDIGPRTAQNAALRTRNIQPLFWAEDIVQMDQLDAYVQAGFNTVVVHLTWPPAPDGQIAAADIEPQRAFAEEAAKRGLKIIYSLPAAPYNQEKDFHISGETGPYKQLWADWTQRAMAQLQNTPNLIGWMLPDDPRSLPFMTNAGFRRWLAYNYGDISVLNQQWYSAFPSFDAVSLAAARQVVELWRGPGALPTSATPDQMRAFIEMSQKRPANQNFAFHPAELALANYEWDSYRSLLDFWARTVRTAAPTQTVLTGRLPDYAQLLSVPPSVDISIPSLAPAWAEKDVGTHNPQAVSVARRGGRFDAIPMLSTWLPGAPDDLVPRLVPSWCDAMAAKGARGVAFDSWPMIIQNPALLRSVTRTLSRMKQGDTALLWGKMPQATTAVVLTPLADGYTIHPPAPPSEGPNAPPVPAPPARGLFGFGEDMISGEPSDLVYELRWGTLFGNVDFISPDELGGTYSMASGGVLKRYSTVLMPQALWISPSMAQELANYIGGGGTVVADLGIGAWQNKGQVLGFSEALTLIFGVIPTGMQHFAFNLKAAATHPLLPNWSALASTSPREMTKGEGPENAAFAGPMLFGELVGGTIPIAQAFQYAVQDKRQGDDKIRVMRSWLSLRPIGAGNAIFAPFRLWTLWRPGYPGFDQFHGDLFARNASLTHLNVQALVPAPPGTPDGNALYPEATNFSEAVAVINHNAAAGIPYVNGSDVSGAAPVPPQPAIVQTAGVEQFVWSNALCLFPVGAAPSVTMGRLPPVSDFTGAAGDSTFVVAPVAHPVILHTFVPPQEMRVMRMLPIRALSPNGGPLACRVREYSSKRIELRVWPNAQAATPSANNDWSVVLGQEGAVRVVVFDSNEENAYRLAPGSKHRVAITEVSAIAKTPDQPGNQAVTTRNYILTADARGTLPLEIRGTSLRIEILPYEAPAETPTPDKTGPATPSIVPDTSSAIVPDEPPDATPEEAAKAAAAAPKPEDKTPPAITPDGQAPHGGQAPPDNSGEAPLFRRRYNQ